MSSEPGVVKDPLLGSLTACSLGFANSTIVFLGAVFLCWCQVCRSIFFKKQVQELDLLLCELSWLWIDLSPELNETHTGTCKNCQILLPGWKKLVSGNVWPIDNSSLEVCSQGAVDRNNLLFLPAVRAFLLPMTNKLCLSDICPLKSSCCDVLPLHPCHISTPSASLLLLYFL